MGIICQALFVIWLTVQTATALAVDSCIVNPPNPPSSSIETKNLLGTYRRLPVQNDYHVGTIQAQAGNGNLIWTNQHGVSWKLIPDLGNLRLLTGTDNPYQNSPNGANFTLQFQSGRLTGFIFLGESYLLDDAFADTYDPNTSKLLISKVSVGTRSYCNVVATIGSVVSVGAPPANGIGDQFDPATGRLTIPSLRLGDKTYNNVVVTLSNVLNAEVLPDYLSGGTLHGYAALNIQESPPEFHYGFSLYTSIQKISDYQVKNLQFGWGTWLVPDNRANKLLCPLGTVMRNLYPNQGTFWSQFQTIEGGPGQWISTHFPSTISKFRLNSTPDCYNNEVASPGYDFLGNRLKTEMLGMAQLSNRLLIAPDGLTFDLHNLPSSLFGYGYLALPLMPANDKVEAVPIGDQSWVLVMNSENFKGPVSFYLPKLFTKIDALDKTLVSKTLDAMPAVNSGLALEINTVPAYTAVDPSGVVYRRIAKMNFPTNESSTRAILTQDFTHYSKQALWDNFASFMSGGVLPLQLNSKGGYPVSFTPSGLSAKMVDNDKPVILNGWVTSSISKNQSGGTVFSLSWVDPVTAGTLPEYFRLDDKGWTPIQANQVPATTNLSKQIFPALTASSWPTLDTSTNSAWSSSKWAAGPFTAKLNDGSTVTYVWYNFIDQPAIAQLGLDPTILQKLQNAVEIMHIQYGTNGPTLEPPTNGSLVGIDPGLIVTPPSNMSKGYVPIAIGQQ